MIQPITRIAARYVSGALITYGVLDAPDPVLEADIALIIGTALGVISEAFYAVAVRRGWRK